MKTQATLISIKNGLFLLVGFAAITLLTGSCARTVYVTDRQVVHHAPARSVAPPVWAPEYEYVEEVNYYYLPDIEIYYDVYRNEYVYLDGGRWVYSRAIPAHCAHYDINTAYVVVLERNIRNPWERHHSYVSNYPRYYYRSKYQNNGNHYGQNKNLRGYNENARNVIYHDPKNVRSQRGNSSSQDSYRANQNSNQRSNPGNNNQYQRTYTPSSRTQSTQNQSRSEYKRDNGANPPAANVRNSQAQPQPETTGTAPAPQQRERSVQPERRERERNPNASRNENQQRDNSEAAQSGRTSEPVKAETPAPAPQQRERSAQPERRERSAAPARSEATQRVKSEGQPSASPAESTRPAESRSRSRR